MRDRFDTRATETIDHRQKKKNIDNDNYNDTSQSCHLLLLCWEEEGGRGRE